MSKMSLCYVDGNFAYFTPRPVDKQWGDDWNDAPYEHNAGSPYEEMDGEKVEIAVVAWSGALETPSCRHFNSPYSVQAINAKRAPWLMDPYGSEVVIWAGTSIEEFILLVKKSGGKVYLEV